MSILVSIHDVTPALEKPLRALWSLCTALGVRPALFLSPWSLGVDATQRARFLDWVYARADQGAKVLLQQVILPASASDIASREWPSATPTFPPPPPPRDRQIELETRVLLASGIRVTGVVAASWLARLETRDAARGAGLLVAEDARFVWMLRDDRAVPAPRVTWDTATRPRARRERSSVQRGWRAPQESPLVRLALHPRDVADPARLPLVARAVERWMGERPAVGYGTLAGTTLFGPVPPARGRHREVGEVRAEALPECSAVVSAPPTPTGGRAA